MEQARKSELTPLRVYVGLIKLHAQEERKAKLRAIMSRPQSSERDDFIHQAEKERVWRIGLIRDFCEEWHRIYGFPYIPQCGCEERIPKEEFDFLRG